MKCIIRKRTQWMLRSILPPFFLLSPGNILGMELERLILYTALQAKRKWNENVNEDIGGVFFFDLSLCSKAFATAIWNFVNLLLHTVNEFTEWDNHVCPQTCAHRHKQPLTLSNRLPSVDPSSRVTHINACRKCQGMCGLINSRCFTFSILE